MKYLQHRGILFIIWSIIIIGLGIYVTHQKADAVDLSRAQTTFLLRLCHESNNARKISNQRANFDSRFWRTEIKILDKQIALDHIPADYKPLIRQQKSALRAILDAQKRAVLTPCGEATNRN